MRKIKSLKIFFISILLIALFLLYPVNILFSDTSSLRIDPTTEFQRYPDICGENVVWMDKRSGETEIYIYNTNSGISGPVFSDGNKQIEPTIYENLVVWSENVSDSSDPVYQVFLYNLLTPDIEPIRIAPTDFDQLQADIYGDKIVWEDFRFGSENTQIYSYDISAEAITRISPTTSSQISPHIYENKIVWSDNIDNAATDFYKYQAYLFDIDTSLITRIDPFNSRQDVTSIYQDKIVYSDTRNADISQVYIYDITTNSSLRLYPTFGYQYGAKISGNKVIWLENYQIYIYDIAAGGMAARVDPTSYNQLYPDIYSDSIVWEDERDLHNNKQQIYIQSLPLAFSPSIFESFFARMASIIRNPVFVRDDMATKLSRMLLSVVNKIINIYNAFTSNNVRQIIDFPILDGSNPYENRELEILEEDKIDGAETEKEEEPEEIEEETKEEEQETEEETEEVAEEEEKAPTIELEVYEGPILSGNICYYIVKAKVAGNPTPEVKWNRDDSEGAWGPLKAQVNLSDPSEAFTLKATATNSKDKATDSIKLSWGCEKSESESEDTKDGGDTQPANLFYKQEYLTVCDDLSGTIIDTLGIRLANETNYIVLIGDMCTSFDQAIKAYLTFSIDYLNFYENVNITYASLIIPLESPPVGHPELSGDQVIIEACNYGDTLDLNDWTVPGTAVEGISTGYYTTDLNVTSFELKNAVQWAVDDPGVYWFQIKLYRNGVNNNYQDDYYSINIDDVYLYLEYTCTHIP
jgi:TolB protein